MMRDFALTLTFTKHPCQIIITKVLAFVLGSIRGWTIVPYVLVKVYE